MLVTDSYAESEDARALPVDNQVNTASAPTIPEPAGSSDDTARHRVVDANKETSAPTNKPVTKPFTTSIGETQPYVWTHGSQADFDTYDMNFRKHYATHYGKTGYAYDFYLPSYRYGYELGLDPRYTSLMWAEVEPAAQKAWLEQYPEGDWDSFYEAVHYAWEQARSVRVGN